MGSCRRHLGLHLLNNHNHGAYVYDVHARQHQRLGQRWHRLLSLVPAAEPRIEASLSFGGW